MSTDALLLTAVQDQKLQPYFLRPITELFEDEELFDHGYQSTCPDRLTDEDSKLSPSLS